MNYRFNNDGVEAFLLGTHPMPDWFGDRVTRNDVILHLNAPHPHALINQASPDTERFRDCVILGSWIVQVNKHAPLMQFTPREFVEMFSALDVLEGEPPIPELRFEYDFGLNGDPENPRIEEDVKVYLGDEEFTQSFNIVDFKLEREPSGGAPVVGLKLYAGVTVRAAHPLTEGRRQQRMVDALKEREAARQAEMEAAATEGEPKTEE